MTKNTIQTQEKEYSIAPLKNTLDNIYFDKKYYSSYPIFLEFCNNIESFDAANLIIAANASYGWMPTILTIHKKDLSEQVRIVNNLKKKNTIPTADEFTLLKSTFNNSIVGTSKLLHFINPEIIPIWDSRVSNYLNKNYGFNKRVNTVPKFIHYLNFCKNIITNPDFEKLYAQVQEKFEYRVTKLRVLEQIMFHGSKN